jgi:hypothetical protein
MEMAVDWGRQLIMDDGWGWHLFMNLSLYVLNASTFEDNHPWVVLQHNIVILVKVEDCQRIELCRGATNRRRCHRRIIGKGRGSEESKIVIIFVTMMLIVQFPPMDNQRLENCMV